MASCTSIQNVDQNHDDKTLTVRWTDKEKQVYPYIWLRDNCQCRTVCWHESGLVPMPGYRFNIDVEIVPKTLKVIGEISSSNLIEIEWSDGHKSQYLSSWLRQFKFDNSANDAVSDPTLRYWDAGVVEKQLKKFEFSDIISNDEVLLDWLVELKELGIAMIKGTPTKEGQLHEIGKRVAFLHPTCFGRERIWKLQQRFSADGGTHSNAGFQSGYLPLHTDQSYYQRPPGILLFHCLQNVSGEGGESLVVDGFKVAEDLKREHREAFDLLTSTIFDKFSYENHADAFALNCHHDSRHSVIELGPRGEIQRVVLDHNRRNAMLRVPVSKVLPTYRALKLFGDKLYDPANLFQLKLKEGDMLCMNNERLLHGRTEFKPTPTTDRHFEGAYLDWDQANSRIRVLREENNKK